MPRHAFDRSILPLNICSSYVSCFFICFVRLRTSVVSMLCEVWDLCERFCFGVQGRVLSEGRLRPQFRRRGEALSVKCLRENHPRGVRNVQELKSKVEIREMPKQELGVSTMASQGRIASSLTSTSILKRSEVEFELFKCLCKAMTRKSF